MKVFRSFEESRKFVRELDLKSQREWNQYVKSGKKPDDIPSFPPQTYREEWKSWGDWLGTGTVANWNKEFASYEDAKEIARNYKIHNAAKWREFSKTKKRPNNIPTAPERVYKEDGWTSIADWLGKEDDTKNKESKKKKRNKK